MKHFRQLYKISSAIGSLAYVCEGEVSSSPTHCQAGYVQGVAIYNQVCSSIDLLRLEASFIGFTIAGTIFDDCSITVLCILRKAQLRKSFGKLDFIVMIDW